jgi:hypothetical protein
MLQHCWYLLIRYGFKSGMCTNLDDNCRFGCLGSVRSRDESVERHQDPKQWVWLAGGCAAGRVVLLVGLAGGRIEPVQVIE